MVTQKPSRERQQECMESMEVGRLAGCGRDSRCEILYLVPDGDDSVPLAAYPPGSIS